MKILTNKKYNELILKPLQNCFAQVDDDMLLRENGLLYAENEKLHSIIKEAREYLTSTTHFVLEYDKPFRKLSKYEEQYEKREEDLLNILKGEDNE